ncbi:MAG TPA: glycerol-3-phosphate acyltransferase, partial [Rhodobacteraceae bacterium]|nr:glycerol-3-phosphate acyltransferase [Paracoccaceae bacterium]
LLLGYPTMMVLCLALTILVFWRHRSNILRLSKGQETKIGAKN